MKQKIIPPKHGAPGFHCPNCHLYANQLWSATLHGLGNTVRSLGREEVPGLMISLCTHCKKYAVWKDEQMIWPDNASVEAANEDLTPEIASDYNEAASIVNKSPRGSAALLRLAIQKLCVILGEKGKKIDEDIASLVKKGLPVPVQKALDIVRVVGNEAVHPGELDLKDDIDTATELFGLINIIAEIMISQPKRIGNLYNSLPEAKRKAIEDRDRPKTGDCNLNCVKGQKFMTFNTVFLWKKIKNSTTKHLKRRPSSSCVLASRCLAKMAHLPHY